MVILTTLKGFVGASANLDISYCHQLSHESVMEIINGLATVSGKTLTLNSTTYNKLTAAELAIATGKGWTVASNAR